jgi:hypothetical protein
MNPPGFNPLEWNCIISGCFNYHRHFDIEHLAQCFPRGINFTDLDGFVELGGNFLVVEFKMNGADATGGQQRAFQALTALSERIKVLVVRCDYRTSEIFGLKVIKGGHVGEWKECDFDRFIQFLTHWAARAQQGEAA